jgi:probable rRNA maturation factor
VSIEVEVEDAAWTEALPEAVAVVERAATAALKSAHPREGGDPGLSSGLGAVQTWVPASAGMSGDEEVTVLLADDAAIRDLNARFRGKDKPTNVLSFPAPDFARPHLGDVALAYGVCAGEAETQGKSLADHLAHLTVHGVLHLLGWDHEAEAQAEAMEAMERRILETLGVADPYGSDAHG